jgi:hypothetical protein
MKLRFMKFRLMMFLCLMRLIRGVGGSFSLALLAVAGNFGPVLFIFLAPVGLGVRPDGEQRITLGLGGAATEVQGCSV